jgi:hypothetical protein
VVGSIHEITSVYYFESTKTLGEKVLDIKCVFFCTVFIQTIFVSNDCFSLWYLYFRPVNEHDSLGKKSACHIQFQFFLPFLALPVLGFVLRQNKKENVVLQVV